MLARRRTNGRGFSYLFQVLMEQLAIKCHSVTGFVRREKRSSSTSNHMWNLVLIGTHYYYVDCSRSADSRSLAEHLTKHNKETLSKYFLFPKPRDLLKTYYPEDDTFVLMDGFHFNYESFTDSPIYHLGFYYSEVSMLSEVKFQQSFQGCLGLRFRSDTHRLQFEVNVNNDSSGQG